LEKIMNDQRQLLDGLAVVRIDAGPNDVAMLPPVLGVEDDGARLADQLRGPRTARDFQCAGEGNTSSPVEVFSRARRILSSESGTGIDRTALPLGWNFHARERVFILGVMRTMPRSTSIWLQIVCRISWSRAPVCRKSWEGDVLLGGACEEKLLQLIDAASCDFAGREVRQVAACDQILNAQVFRKDKTTMVLLRTVRTEPAVGQELFVLQDATNYHPSCAHLQGMFSA
jgi:hypothetical protein